MIIGSLLCVFALLLFGYTRPVASVFVRFGTSAVCYHMFYSVLSLYFIDWGVWIQNNVLTIWLAVLSIYCIDFSINAGWSPLLLLLSLPYLTETPSNGSRPRPNGRRAALPRAALRHSLGSADGFYRRHCRVLYVPLSSTLSFQPALY